MEFCQQHDHHFIGQGRNSVLHARHYITGLMGTQRSKNIETFENDVAGSDYQDMEQFISSSPWDHRALMDDVARDAGGAIGHDHEAGFFLDETSFLKKGGYSVDVQRQWSGRAGKVENCQVGVFASLGRGDEFALIEKQRSRATPPLLSVRDIVELLDYYLPRRNREEEDIHAQIAKRHAARQWDIDRRKLHKPGGRKVSDLTK